MRTLPDITSDINAEITSSLQWVGMEDIAVPISVNLQDDKLRTIVAKASVYVSLETPNAKGIHMSRVYSIINQLAELELNKENIEILLNEMIRSQRGIGHEAKIKLAFHLLLRKTALLSSA